MALVAHDSPTLNDMQAIAVIQPSIPAYRATFFQRVIAATSAQVRIFADGDFNSQPSTTSLQYRRCRIDTLLPGRLFWQRIPRDVLASDVIVVSGNIRFLNIPLLLCKARAAGRGIVWWGHLRSRTSTRIGVHLRLRLMRCCDAVLLYNESERQELLGRRFEPERVVALGNTVATDRISHCLSRLDIADIAERRGVRLTERRLHLSFCGRILQRKRLDLLIAACNELSRSWRSITITILGDGPDRGAVEALAMQAERNVRTVFLGAAYDEDAIARYIAHSDLMVHPGPVGLGLLHALAYGVPVVTHDNRHNHGPEASILEADYAPLLFRQADVHDLARVIAQSMCNYSDVARIAEKYRTIIHHKFGMAQMVQRFIDACNCAAAHRAAQC